MIVRGEVLTVFWMKNFKTQFEATSIKSYLMDTQNPSNFPSLCPIKKIFLFKIPTKKTSNETFTLIPIIPQILINGAHSNYFSKICAKIGNNEIHQISSVFNDQKRTHYLWISLCCLVISINVSLFFDLNSCVKLHGLLKLVFGERLESLLWKWIFLNWGVFSSNGNSCKKNSKLIFYYILVYNLLHISIFFSFFFHVFCLNFNIACTFDDAFDFDVNRSLSGFINQISSTKLYNRILCVFPLIYWFLLGFWTYINQILELISLWF